MTVNITLKVAPIALIAWLGVSAKPMSDFARISDAFCDANGILDGMGLGQDRNAIAHALTSALLTSYIGDDFTSLFGQVHEAVTLGLFDDAQKDLWNNEVGSQIANWILENGYDFNSVIGDLLIDAYNNGQLITDINDPRLASGESPTWEPSPSWEGASGSPIGSLDEGMASFLSGLGSVLAGLLGGLSGLLPPWMPGSDPLHPAANDPLVLDLNGDGLYTFIDYSESSVHMDYDGDGFAERSSWISPEDGFLVWDANGNGLVDGAYELFGDTGSSAVGYQALAQLDSNGDGVINASDDDFNALRVWQDFNSDGVTDAGELKNLAAWQIEAINTGAGLRAGVSN